MRKVALLAVAALLTVAAVAFAQTQVNTYAVQGSVSPNTSKGPLGVKFNYQVGEKSGNRPSAVQTYNIGFFGVHANGGLFPKCSASAIAGAKSAAKCPKGSQVGTGTVISKVGPDNDVTQSPITCTKALAVFNSGAGKSTLFLTGPATACGGVGYVPPIATKYKAGPGGGSVLVFTVPPAVLHPLAGLTTAVVDVKSTIKKLKAKNGKGYYQGLKCGPRGKRALTVTFVSEAGQSTPVAADTGKCR